MNIIFKKTTQLSQIEKKQICQLFENVFEKQKTLEFLEHQFLGSPKGYSYHALMVDSNEIVGCYTAIPYEYNYFGQKYFFALSVDTMIRVDHRGDPLNLNKMSSLVYAELKNDGIVFVFAFPNDNIYMIRKTLLKWQDIARLSFYMLPINIGTVAGRFTFLNILSRFGASLVNGLVKHSNSTGNVSFNVSKVDDDKFKKWRYDSGYETVYEDERYAYTYKLDNYEGVRVAYLLDVASLEKAHFEQAVKAIYDKEKSRIDAILYIGNLSFAPKNIIKIPKRFEPKNIWMSGKILDKNMIDERIFDVESWNVNLSNYDVV